MRTNSIALKDYILRPLLLGVSTILRSIYGVQIKHLRVAGSFVR